MKDAAFSDGIFSNIVVLRNQAPHSDRQNTDLLLHYDTEIIFKRFVVDNIPHNRCKGNVQLVGSLDADTDRQRTLRVSVDKQNLFTGVMKPNSEIQCRSGFTRASFLIFDCNYFAAHNIYLLYFVAVKNTTMYGLQGWKEEIPLQTPW